jgi:predicted membrane chloride channel (bestrophin family)
MIQYDPKSWLGVIFRLNGSVLPRLTFRILASALAGAGASWLTTLETIEYRRPNS